MPSLPVACFAPWRLENLPQNLNRQAAKNAKEEKILIVD
jgi:hypothetical protein